LAEIVETSVDEFHVALLRLNRPEARNALSPEMMERIAAELERLDPDPDVRCVVIAGSDEIFAAGADIKAMAARTLPEALYHPSAAFWRRLVGVKTPLVAAVTGFALGGGCELALACDMIVADEAASFGQPEIRLGIIPGGGGPQRLARAIAHAWGLVNKVAEQGHCLDEALALARTVAERPPIATRLAKQAVLAAEETALSAGLEAERRMFELAMATEDRVEGMQAFLEKREPDFKGR
jgi:enoyl-CoA hydratase/carnithine racemase